MNIDWSSEKNEILEQCRGISFEIIANKIAMGDTLLNTPHPNADKYPNQYVYVVNIDNYCYVVPYVKSEEGIFLKTIFPSREMTKRFLGVKDENDR